MKTTRRILSFLMSVVLVLSVTYLPTFATSSVTLTTIVSSDSEGENPITSVAQNGTFYFVVKTNGLSASNPLKAYDLLIGCPTNIELNDEDEKDGKISSLTTTNISSGVLIAGWADGSGKKNDTGKLFYIGLKATAALDSTELAKFKLLESWSDKTSGLYNTDQSYTTNPDAKIPTDSFVATVGSIDSNGAVVTVDGTGDKTVDVIAKTGAGNEVAFSRLDWTVTAFDDGVDGADTVPDGAYAVTFVAGTGNATTINVPAKAKAGTYTIQAAAKSSESATLTGSATMTLTVEREAAAPASIAGGTITGNASLAAPDATDPDATVSDPYMFSGTVKDQFDDTMDAADYTVTWSIAKKSGTGTGVTVDAETGVVTVPATAKASDVWTLTASVADGVSTTKDISITALTEQTGSFADSSKTVTYGDEGFTNALSVTVGPETKVITYELASETPAKEGGHVASVNEETGAVTILGAGSAVIKATSRKNDSTYGTTEFTYNLTVNKKTLTATISAVDSKEYDGEVTTTGGAISLTGTVGNDNVTATGTIVWTSADANTTTVSASEVTLDGADKDNYTVATTISSTTAPNEAKISKATNSWTTEPTAKTLTYSGSAQALVSEGTAAVGTVQYKLGDGSYGNSVPTATDAGTYTVSYKVEADANHDGLAEGSVQVTIAPKNITPVVELTPDTLNFTNADQKSGVTVDVYTDSTKATKLTLDTDYTLAWSKGGSTVAEVTDVGTYTVTATGVDSGSNYKFTTATATFTMDKAAQTTAVTVSTISGVTYGADTTNITVSGGNGTGAFSLVVNEDTDATENEFIKITASEGKFTITPKKASTAANSVTVYGKRAGDNNYADAYSTAVTFNIAKATPTIGDFTITTPTKQTYDGTAKSVAAPTVKSGITGMGDVTVKYDSSATVPTDAGNYTVTFDVAAGDNYDAETGLSIGTLTIAPKSIAGVTITGLPTSTEYTGTAITPTYTVQDGTKTLTKGSDYTEDYNSTNTDVGTATLTITGKGNYDTTTTKTATFEITKKAQTAPTVTGVAPTAETEGAKGKIQGATTDMEYKGGDVTEWTTCEANQEVVPGTYQVRLKGTDNLEASPVTEVTVPSHGKFSLTVVNGTGGGEKAAGDEVTVTANAAPAGQKFVKWDAEGIDISSNEGKNNTSITITMPSGNVSLTAKYEDIKVESVSLPATLSMTTGGTQTLTPTFTPSDAKDKAVTWASADESIVSVDANGKLTAVKAGGPVNITVTTHDGSKTATCAVTVKAPTPAPTPTPTPTPSSTDSTIGGGGGGGGYTPRDRDTDSSTTTNKNTTTNADGSTTTTVKNSDGSVTETTRATDGSTTTTKTEKTGEATTTEKAADGSTGTTKTDAAGNTVAASATVSQQAVRNAARYGSAVKVPVSVKASNSAASAAAVDIALPETSEPVAVEIPVENVSAGTVAVIVHPDGTEEIVKTSTVGKDGVVLTLDGSAKVKIVDNSKYFADVPSYEWYSDNVAWASSREIMNGTGDFAFAPNDPTSRSMVAQLLFNLDGAAAPNEITTLFADVNPSDWYANSVTWAVSSGVARGMGDNLFGANQVVTREQFAVMMYNYAKLKGYDVSTTGSLASFPDAGSVSDWAADAMAWAVGVGLINGTTDANGSTVLNAQGTATRAQVAAIMQRFCEKVAK